MSSKARKLLKGSVLGTVEFLAGALVGLILMPFIIHSLGDKMYGLWIFVGSFLGYYGLMDFGLSSAVQRFISRAIGSKDYTESNKIVNTSLFIFSIIGIAALFVSMILAFLVPVIIKNIEEVSLFRTLILILGINFAVGFPLRVFNGVLAANIRYDISTVIALIKLAVRTLLVIIALKNNLGIIALAVITFIVDIAGYSAMYIAVMKLFKYIRISRNMVDFSKIRSLFSYSIYTFISQIADQLKFNIDNLVIVAFIGLNPVTLYSIASRLIQYFMSFMAGAVGSMSLPVFSQYEGANDYQSIRDKYLFLTKVSSSLSFLVGGTLIIFGKAFIVAWVGEQYSQAYIILLILLIPFIFDVMQMPGNGLLYGLSKHKYFALANVIEGSSKLILSIILVRKYGIMGVAMGTAIPMLIMKIFIQPVYTCKIIGLNYRQFYVNILLPGVALSAGTLGLFWLLVRNYIKASMPLLLTLISIELIFVSFIFYISIFSKQEKQYFTKAFIKPRIGD